MWPFDAVTDPINDWWKKYQYVVYAVIALIVLVLIAYIWRSFR